MVSAEGPRAPGRPFSQPLLTPTALEPCRRSRGPAAGSGLIPARLGLRGGRQAGEGRRRGDPGSGGRGCLAAAVTL